MTTSITKKSTDITIYGATSFVAKHVITYLTQSAVLLDEGRVPVLKITLAGRDAAKLSDLEAVWEKRVNLLLQTMDDRATGRVVWDTYVADGNDDPALQAMAARTKVVLNCAGPFALYSSGVVAACAEMGTDYVDITGEVSWVAAMREAHGATAAKSGARIVSLCGYDSIPSDLSVLAAVQALRDKKKAQAKGQKAGDNANVAIVKATTWHTVMGLPNGGTYKTAQDYPMSWERCKSNGIPFLLDDPLVLTHPTAVRQNLAVEAWRARLVKAEWWNAISFQFHAMFKGGISAPFIMASVNAKVVHASAAALHYGGDDDDNDKGRNTFIYQERLLPVGFRGTAQLQTFSFIPALLTHVFTLLGMLLLRLPILGPCILKNILGGPGTGLSDAMCAGGHAEVYAEIRTAPHPKTGKVDKANALVQFKGDPGNWVTAQCVSEAALTLLLTDRKTLPARSADGFGTPAELLGMPLLQRLQQSKVRPVNVVTDARIQTAVTEWRMYP
eukprot:scaffold311_cov173-Amphora_coffeaeformis.AAC.7